jgi:hypothetical protein
VVNALLCGGAASGSGCGNNSTRTHTEVVRLPACLPALPTPTPACLHAWALFLAQVGEIAGALGWRLSDAHVAELDAVSGKIPNSTGAPFENW